MGQVIQFPMSRVRRKRRPPVDVFAGHFELLNSGGVWDRLLAIRFVCVTLIASV